MTITNIGYDGTVSDLGFAQMQQYAGVKLPVVAGLPDFAVTINAAATRTCNVAVGSAYAPGVLSTSDAVESAVFDVVSTTGQTRWDAVVLRRDWSTGTSTTGTTVVVVKGTAAAAAPMVLPSGVDQILDSGLDQVLALVQLTNGQLLPTAVVDRRLQASKVFTAPSVAALPTASTALYGMEAIAAGVRYRCDLVAGSPAWIGETPSVQVVSSDSGFPTATTNATTATVVIDRFTIPASPFARTAQLVSSAYVVVNPAGTQLNLVAFLGGSPIGYARKAIGGTTTPDQLVVVGAGTIPANSSAVVEVRLSRFSEAGAFSSSTSSGLTKTNLTLVRI